MPVVVARSEGDWVALVVVVLAGSTVWALLLSSEHCRFRGKRYLFVCIESTKPQR